MNAKSKNVCPNCGAEEIHYEYHSYFRCGTCYESNEQGKYKRLTKPENGYYLSPSLQCAFNCIGQILNRLNDIDSFIKKQTEIPEKNLRSLEEYNKEKLINYAKANGLESGFACPQCKEEMFYANPGTVLTTYPPKRQLQCPHCQNIQFVVS